MTGTAKDLIGVVMTTRGWRTQAAGDVHPIAAATLLACAHEIENLLRLPHPMSHEHPSGEPVE